MIPTVTKASTRFMWWTERLRNIIEEPPGIAVGAASIRHMVTYL